MRPEWIEAEESRLFSDDGGREMEPLVSWLEEEDLSVVSRLESCMVEEHVAPGVVA